MSSILTALKKIENQAKNKSPVWLRQQKNQDPTPRPQRLGDHLRVNKRYLIILAGLILAGIAGIALTQKIRHHHRNVTAKSKVVAIRESLTKHSAHLSDQKPVASNKVESKSPVPKKTIIPGLSQKEAKMPSAPIHTSRAAPLTGINNKKAVLPKPVNDVNKKTTLPQKPVNDIINGKAMPSKPAEKETVRPKGSEKNETQVKPDRFARLPVKQAGDTHIEIQALAWSKDPKSRLAVINGLILRQGESIDNVMIVDIGKDAVVFEKNREEWKQLFGF